MLTKLPSGRYIDIEEIVLIAPSEVKGLTGQLPIAVAMHGGAGIKLQGKDAKALFEALQHHGLLLTTTSSEEVSAPEDSTNGSH